MTATGPDNEPLSELSAILREIVGPERLQNARSAFAQIDTNRDGRIELAEVLAHLLAAEQERITQQFESYDVNGDGYIDFDEFLFAVVPSARLVRAFREFDTDRDGLLSCPEILQLSEALALPLAAEQLASFAVGADRLVAEADGNSDGKLTFYELHGLLSYHGLL